MTNKKKYLISLHGCDDSTEFEMELTVEEKDLILRVVELANETSFYGCMPKMEIVEAADETR